MRESIQILGNRIDCFYDYEELYSWISSDIKMKNQSGYVTVNNVHTMIEGFWDRTYQEVINQSYLSIPDGKPLQIIGKLKGHSKISRLFGPSVMEYFIDKGCADQVSHFFFGSSEANLLKLKKTIENKYPGAKIAGMISPPYRPAEEWDNDLFIRQINEVKPDFIWVGLGAPKQERWMHRYCDKIDRGILFGIGAGFDYLAGNTRHAPLWMKNYSLEWAFRLYQEPKRLWKRYLRVIPQFVFFAFFELMGIRFKNTVKSR